ncbi:unnamed protein product [Durusdinium trenchii]|uniref:Uncharacterized protein n=1 Tax=Durusdinium trenchii TaxID=1381693 RepID=A0ABP0PJB5_9DINO
MVKAIPCCGFALSEAQLVFWLTIVQSGSLELHFLEAEGKLSTQLHNVSDDTGLRESALKHHHMLFANFQGGTVGRTYHSVRRWRGWNPVPEAGESTNDVLLEHDVSSVFGIGQRSHDYVCSQSDMPMT